MNSILKVEELCVSFTTNQARLQVVEGVSFQLAAGEVVGLVGESGCGKSVTGAALMGMVPQPAGQASARTMRLGLHDLTSQSAAGWQRIRGRELSMIFQLARASLDPVFPIGSQLVEVICRHQKCSRRAALQLAKNLLQQSGMGDQQRILESYPHELSGGMCQRIMIAMAMANKPRVLIADEPTSALDVTTQGQILQQIRLAASDCGTAVLIISHDLGAVAQICDRVLVMYCGRIVEEGAVGALFSRPFHPYTAGLLAAMPKADGGLLRPVTPIPGSVPHPGNLPPGCHFHTRCGLASPRCRADRPELHSMERLTGSSSAPRNLRRAACHHPLQC